MIDYEEEIYGSIVGALKSKYDWAKAVCFSSEYVNAPARFPHVFIMEVDNRSSPETKETTNADNFAVLTYEVNTYSNMMPGKKRECREIASAVDQEMIRLGFSRNSLLNTPNIGDNSIYRMTGRYTVQIGADGVLYHKT